MTYFLFFRITSPFNKRKIKESPPSKQLLHTQQQQQSQHASNIPTPKKFSFNGPNMISAFTTTAISTKMVMSGVPVYHSNANDSGSQIQQNNRLMMRSTNQNTYSGHFALSESSYSGKNIIIPL